MGRRDHAAVLGAVLGDLRPVVATDDHHDELRLPAEPELDGGVADGLEPPEDVLGRHAENRHLKMAGVRIDDPGSISYFALCRPRSP